VNERTLRRMSIRAESALGAKSALRLAASHHLPKRGGVSDACAAAAAAPISAGRRERSA